MFANDWRWQQFHEACVTKELNYTIKTASISIKKYCERVWLNCDYQRKARFATMLSIVYAFFFKVRDFHYYITHKQKYVKYIIFGVEAMIVVGIMMYVYVLLIPSATITVTPSYDIEEVSYNFRLIPYEEYKLWYSGTVIALPYYEWVEPYRTPLRTPIQSIRYSAETAKGQVIIINSTDREYSLKPYTRFITDNDLVFKTSSWVNLPPQSQTQIELLADDVDDAGQLMGLRGNITSGTVLYIRNLNESRVRKQIVANAVTDFTGGDTLARGIVTQQDINAFNTLAQDTITESASQIIRESVKDPSIIPLMYPMFISGTIQEVDINAKVGEPMIEFDGQITANIAYRFLKQEDINRAIRFYFDQRGTQSLRLVNIQQESLKMYDPIDVSTGVYSMPMTISTFWSYNFDSDIGGIFGQLLQTIPGMTKDQARQQILSYPDISIAKVSISPFWYQTVPTIKSRIKFQVSDSVSKK